MITLEEVISAIFDRSSLKFRTLMVALLNAGTLVVVVEKQATLTLSSATIRVQNFKNSDQRFWLAEVEKLSPGFIKLSGTELRKHDLKLRK